MALDSKYIPLFNIQKPFIDKDTGMPLAAGVVKFYKDCERATTKDVFILSGTEPSYTYTNIGSELTLSSVGTFEYNGNDVVIYGYPYDSDGNIELYYMTVENSGSVSQFTREAIPNLTAGDASEIDDDTNYFINSQFRLYEKATQDFTTTDGYDVAFRWKFKKSNTTAIDKYTIKDFPIADVIEGSPTKYIHYENTGIGSGEVSKDFQYDIEDVNTFNNETLRVSLVLRSPITSKVEIIFEQNFGTGGSSTVTKSMGILTATSSFTKMSTNAFIVPSLVGKTIGTDSFVRIILRMPLNTVSDLSFTNAQLNRSVDVLPYKYQEYETNVARTIGSYLPIPSDQDIYSDLYWDGEKFELNAHTGKISTYMLQDLEPGHLAMEGQTVIRTDKIGSTQITYDRLYQKWETDSMGNGNAFGYGDDGFFPRVYTNNALFTNLKKGSIADWADGTAATGFTFEKVHSSSAGYGVKLEKKYDALVFSDYIVYPNPTYITGPFFIREIYGGSTIGDPRHAVILADGSKITGGDHFAFENEYVAAYYVWYTVDGAGTDPAIAGKTGIKVTVLSTDSEKKVGAITQESINGTIGYSVCGYVQDIDDLGRNNFMLLNNSIGAVAATTIGTFTAAQLALEILQTGTTRIQEGSILKFSDIATTSVAGKYWTFDTPTASYYVWYKANGTGTDPAVVGRTGILVELSSTDIGECRDETIRALEGFMQTKITTVAASALSGGKWFSFNNVGNAFYGWITKDGVGTDPAPAGKVGVKIDIATTDTDAQVATKVSKAISSYYYVIPDIRGYFLRQRDNGVYNDYQTNRRRDRGDGVGGDNIGTTQRDSVGPHDHRIDLLKAGEQTGLPDYPYGFIYGRIPSYAGDFGYATNYTRLQGKNFETRPLNIYVNYQIKF